MNKQQAGMFNNDLTKHYISIKTVGKRPRTFYLN